jgi:hypothetical protein
MASNENESSSERASSVERSAAYQSKAKATQPKAKATTAQTEHPIFYPFPPFIVLNNSKQKPAQLHRPVATLSIYHAGSIASLMAARRSCAAHSPLNFSPMSRSASARPAGSDELSADRSI